MRSPSCLPALLFVGATRSPPGGPISGESQGSRAGIHSRVVGAVRHRGPAAGMEPVVPGSRTCCWLACWHGLISTSSVNPARKSPVCLSPVKDEPQTEGRSWVWYRLAPGLVQYLAAWRMKQIIGNYFHGLGYGRDPAGVPGPASSVAKSASCSKPPSSEPMALSLGPPILCPSPWPVCVETSFDRSGGSASGVHCGWPDPRN